LISKDESKMKTHKRKVNFSLKAPHAKEVFLVGDFNNWDTGADSMKLVGNGLWRTSLILSPGRYEFKFFIDGKWREGLKGKHKVPNCFGTLNHVLVVPEKGK
jgi:1,4-alpha-glucan branching enzyme